MEKKSAHTNPVPQHHRVNVAALAEWSRTANDYAKTIQPQAQNGVATEGTVGNRDLFLPLRRAIVDPEYRKTQEYKDGVERLAASVRELLHSDELANPDILRLIEKPAPDLSDSNVFGKDESISVKSATDSDDAEAGPQDWVLIDKLTSGVKDLGLEGTSMAEEAPKAKNKVPLVGK